MAVFSKFSVSAGAVAHAEHVFAARRGRADAPRLSACWIRDAEGRLVRAWGEAGVTFES